MPSLRQSSTVIGALLIGGIWITIFYFGKGTSARFLEADKAEIQRIARQICVAAKRDECTLAWGGKQKWFGTLQPAADGLAVAGVDHVREALAAPTWKAAAVAGGTQFTNGQHEVFVSSVSGAITVTRNTPIQ